MKGLRWGVENTSMKDALEYLTTTKSYNLMSLEAYSREIAYQAQILEENEIR